MRHDRNKISIRQAAFLLLTITFTPSIRVIPVYTAERAKEAAWLSPVITFAALILLAYVFQALYKKNKECSLIDLFGLIAGSITGKILAIVYLVWMMLLAALYIRYFAIRLVGSIYPIFNIEIFIAIMLVVIAYTLRFGLTTLARFNEIVLPLLAGLFFILVLLMLPNIKWSFLTPVTYRSIIPVIKASTGVTGIIAYFSFLFIVGDRISSKENIKKAGVSLALFLFMCLTLIITVVLGTFSHSVAERTQMPFLIAVKQISLFNTIEKIESLVVAFWVLSDYVLISFFIICALSILKSFFKLSDTKPITNIYIIFLYYLSLLLAKNVFEMEQLSNRLFIPGNLILGFGLPTVMLVVGKLRKKV